MKTIFDNATTVELIKRISTLEENSQPQWGKMTVYQMLKHCRLWEEMIVGKLHCKRIFIGRIIGKMALKASLKDDKPMKPNNPSAPEVVVKETSGDIVAEKRRWITFIEQHKNFSNPDFVHPFFGKMTKEQIGQFAYKHIDHHLRQFNA